MKSKDINYNHGFTLIEIMVAGVIGLIVTAAATLFWQNINKEYQFSMNQFQLIDQSQQILRQIVTEVRQAEVSMDGGYPLAILEDNQLSFYADIDNDDVVERVRYFVEGNTLKRGILVPSGNPPTYDEANELVRQVADNINVFQLPMFEYYNGNWPGDNENNPLSYWLRPLETRLIKITIPLTIPQYQQNYNYSYSAIVHIRNLKTNL